MTRPVSIPAVCIQSLPACCVICLGDQWVTLRIVSRDASTAAVIRCPHCTSTVDLLALIGGRS